MKSILGDPKDIVTIQGVFCIFCLKFLKCFFNLNEAIHQQFYSQKFYVDFVIVKLYYTFLTYTYTFLFS